MPTAHTASIDDAAELSADGGLASGLRGRRRDADELHDADLTGGLLLVIGGERRGVTRSFVREPTPSSGLAMAGTRPDLGAAAAAAIIGFEALRQRRG